MGEGVPDRHPLVQVLGECQARAPVPAGAEQGQIAADAIRSPQLVEYACGSRVHRCLSRS